MSPEDGRGGRCEGHTDGTVVCMYITPYCTHRLHSWRWCGRGLTGRCSPRVTWTDKQSHLTAYHQRERRESLVPVDDVIVIQGPPRHIPTPRLGEQACPACEGVRVEPGAETCLREAGWKHPAIVCWHSACLLLCPRDCVLHGLCCIGRYKNLDTQGAGRTQ